MLKNIFSFRKKFLFLFLALNLFLFSFVLNSIHNQVKIFAATTPAVDPSRQEDNLPADIVPYTNPVTAAKLYEASTTQLDQLASPKATNTKPNIVVIMVDDVNPIDGRFWTSKRTPAIYNNFISKGINFTEFYGETSLCCPGRVGFLTGQHTQNHGVADLDGTKFNPEESIATELKDKGYFTMLTGKYVNYYKDIPKSKAIPPGWSRFDAIYENQGRYYKYDWITKSSGSAGTTTYYGTDPSDYSTDLIARTAVKRFKEAPIDKPIFAFITPFSIHDPKTVAPRYINDPRCADIQSWKAPNVYEVDVSDKSAYFSDLKNGDPSEGFRLRRNCEVLLATDDLVKKIKYELDAQGRLQNTIFVLTADNGYGFGEHRIPGKTAPYTTHIPLYISWPAARGNTPATNTTVLSNIDLASTFCEVADCEMGPYPNGQSRTDGVSFLPLLKNQTKTLNRDVILESQPIKPLGTDAYNRPTWWAVRTTDENPYGMWHYIEYATGEKEMYDLSNGPCYLWHIGDPGDPCELDNVLSPNSKRPTPANTNDIKNYLATRLRQLKDERGFTPYIPTVTPTPTITITATPTFTPTPTP